MMVISLLCLCIKVANYDDSFSPFDLVEERCQSIVKFFSFLWFFHGSFLTWCVNTYDVVLFIVNFNAATLPDISMKSIPQLGLTMIYVPATTISLCPDLQI